MIVVKVELHSAITGQRKELARMMIHNVGGDAKKGDYGVEVYKGRNNETLSRAMFYRKAFKRGSVTGHRRLALHVWHLVAKALASVGYGGK